MFNRLHFFMNNLCKNTGGSKDQDLMEARRNYADIDLISAIYSSDDIDLKSPILEPVSDKGALLQTFKIARYSAISPPPIILCIHPFPFLHPPPFHSLSAHALPAQWETEPGLLGQTRPILCGRFCSQPRLCPVMLRKAALFAELWDHSIWHSLLWGCL